MSILINESGGLSSVLSLMATNQQQTEAFEKADKDGNGTLDKAELQTFINLISRMSRESADVSELIAAVDKDGSGSIDENELESGLDTLRRMLGHDALPPPGTGDPFKQTDADGNGILDTGEIQTLLDSVTKTTGNTTVDAASLITVLDSDTDGTISRTEFEKGREKVEALLGLPPIRPDFTESVTSETNPSPTSVRFTELLDKLMANYLGNVDGDKQSALLSLLA